MPDQVTVRLPKGLSRDLRAASRRMQLKRSEIVRRALRQFLADPSDLQARPDDRVRRLIGSLESGVPDLAVKHRSQIVESVKRSD